MIIDVAHRDDNFADCNYSISGQLAQINVSLTIFQPIRSRSQGPSATVGLLFVSCMWPIGPIMWKQDVICTIEITLGTVVGGRCSRGHRYKNRPSPERGLRSSPDLYPDLGWPWKSYRREFLSSTLTNTTNWFVAALSLIVDVRTDGHFCRVYYRSSEEMT